MTDYTPTRSQNDLAEMVEMLLDKGIVINADIAVSIGETELLGIQIRAAIASFETAAQYGLEFPEGTDTRRVEAAAGIDRDRTEADDAADSAEESGLSVSAPVARRPAADEGVSGRPSPDDPHAESPGGDPGAERADEEGDGDSPGGGDTADGDDGTADAESGGGSDPGGETAPVEVGGDEVADGNDEGGDGDDGGDAT